jgi:ornithine cyclodeaminase
VARAPAPALRIIGASEVEAILEFTPLIEHLRQAFRLGAEIPARDHHVLATDEGHATLLVMPAWRRQRFIGVKLVTIFPDNPKSGLPALTGVYVLMSGLTGEPLAIIDGRMLTLRRTAAASALAARYLARQDSERLLIVGTGALAPQLIVAHASVRPIRELIVWGRSPDKAERLAQNFSGRRLTARATTDLEAAVRGADVISCATAAETPLIHGQWLNPGQHLDLVGGFTPAMREADDAVIERARLYVDTYAGAMTEAGDIVQPLKSGLITEAAIAGDLAELCQGRRAGRSFYNQITLFKSVGTALEDLAAAEFIFERTRS